ncbi:MAG TPA: hypothetical protein VGF06_15185 [Terriglobales bacterium]|jgi:hypothetical protein
MLWWFLLLAFSAGVVAWAVVSATLRVRRHMKRAAKEPAGHSHE